MESDYQQVPIDSLIPSKTNPRSREKADVELAASIKEHGVLQPLIVRPTGNGKAKYEIVAGVRRFAAARLAGLADVPVLVQELNDEKALEVQIVENLQREDIHPLDEAAGFKRPNKESKLGIADIAVMVSRSAQYIYDRLSLLLLVPKAQELFRKGSITLAHAIPLSRIPAEAQERAIKTEGALFEHEAVLWGDKQSLKPRSPKEVKAWIDQHVKFDAKALPEMVGDLFAKTALVVKKADERKEKIVPITHEHYVQPDARDGQRVYGPRSWKLATGRAGSKSCPSSVIGVVVIGPQRGETFRVCMDKKGCKVHYGEEQKEAQKRAKLEVKGEKGKAEIERTKQQKEYEEQQAKREKARNAFQASVMPILEAVAEKVKKMPTKAGSFLAQLLTDTCARQVYYGGSPHIQNALKPTATLIPLGKKSGDDVVRFCAFMLLRTAAFDWNAYESFPKLAKTFGVDVTKIIAEEAKDNA